MDTVEPDECAPICDRQCDPDPKEVFHQVTQSSNFINCDSFPYLLEDDVCTESEDNDEVFSLSYYIKSSEWCFG